MEISVATACLFVTGLLCFTATSTASVVTVTEFLERDKAKFQLVNVLEVREGVRSRLSCSMHCATDNSCGALLYHQMTHSCTLAQAVGQGVTGLDSDLRLLSVNSELCPHKDGFKHLQISGLNYCLKKSSTQLNYDNSRAACQGYGGDLYTMDGNAAKMKDLLTIVRHLGQNDWFWIGLNDIDKDGTFVWANNGKAVSDTELRALDWNEGEPNNSGRAEDCVLVFHHSAKLNDGYCWVARSYLCEILV